MEVTSLPNFIWSHVVEYLSKSDLHHFLLVSRDVNNIVHNVGPGLWRSLSLKPTSLDLVCPYFSSFYINN